MIKNNKRGFGIITAIVVLAAIILAGAGGTYLLIEHEKKTVSNLFEESSVGSEKDTDGSEEEAVVEEGLEKDKGYNSSKLEKEPVTVAATIHPKDKAEVYIYEDPSGVPNRFNITCKVGTERKVSMFYIYPGDGSEYSDSPIAGRDQISQTHTYPTSSAISYNVKCVPVYDSTDSPFTHVSPYVGSANINVVSTVETKEPEPAGGENHLKLSSEKVNFVFSFTPTSGVMPVYVETYCKAEVERKIIGIDIHRGGYVDNLEDEKLFERSFTFHYSTRGEVLKERSGEGEINIDSWKGESEVYCTVQFEDGSYVSSDPIFINFK